MTAAVAQGWSRRQSASALTLAAGSAGALLSLLLWWHNPATRTVHTPADVVTGVGRAAGLLAAYTLVLQVLLMARIPWLERRIGADWLTVSHRWLGSYLLGLVAVHVAGILVGYSMARRLPVVRETVRVVTTYPDVLYATIGSGLVLVVVLSSLRPWRPALRYETWHLLHLLAYVAIGLAFAHQFNNGAEFVSNKAARVAWVVLHLGVVALLLNYRVVAPVRLWRRHRFRVSDVVTEPDGSTSIYVSGDALHDLPAVAGQFFRWRFLARGHWWQAHPFSLSAAPNGRWLRMTAKPVGDHSVDLADLRPGTAVVLEGPSGAVTAGLAGSTRLLLVAGGSGIAPLLAIAQEAVARGGDVRVVYRIRQEADAVFRQELEAIVGTGRAEVLLVLGSRGHGRRRDPLDAAALRSLVPDLATREAYVCGPPGLIDNVTGSLQALGVPAGRIHSERFAW